MSEQYISDTVQDFFAKLDSMQQGLEGFSQHINEQRETVFSELHNFEQTCALNLLSGHKESKELNGVDRALQRTMEDLQYTIQGWREGIEKNKKGTQFMHKHEKYLVVMVFGAVKAGKSTLGNFFAGREFQKAPFDNVYKHRQHPEFATEERGRNTGDIETDSNGQVWFSEGVTDTTGAIQYFTLSGMRWVDSPGTGALEKTEDRRNMEEMVNEYIPYTDLCIFLMNSSEPGLQADMKYMEQLSRKGQEAIVVITKSDRNEEDEDEDGNIVSCWQAKSSEVRVLQENDICKRLKEKYPRIAADKFRAISISTLLGSQAIAQNNDQLYKESHLDLLMRILGNKVSEEAIRLKERQPKKNVNLFIDSIIEGEENFLGINALDDKLQSVLKEIKKYQNTINDTTRKITSKVSLNAKGEIRSVAREWAANVEKTGKAIPKEEITGHIRHIVENHLAKELNAEIGRIIQNYKQQNIQAIQESFASVGITKQSQTVTTEYTEIYYVPREADGVWEHIRSFFGKTYYRRHTDYKTRSMVVDMGTNVDEFLEDMINAVDQTVAKHVQVELERLQETYFLPQKTYVDKTRKALKKLQATLTSLKYDE